MPLHRLTTITLGVKDVAATADYYTDFGLTPTTSSDDGLTRRFATVDGGEQLKIVRTPRRRLTELGIGVDDSDDLDRISANLLRLGMTAARTATSLTVYEPATEVEVTVEIAPRLDQVPPPAPVYNRPGATPRLNERAPGVEKWGTSVHPRRLGHVVLGSTHHDVAQRFFIEGLGFKISDEVPGIAAFLRCSTDHHNVMIQKAPASLLHHTSWQVDDVDEVGRGATNMLAKDANRHAWGLGRHHIGSNFFYYLKDPAGNFSEYYSDMDCIVDDALWKTQDWNDSRAMWSWGPPPPASFLEPADLAELMTDTHSNG
jgi:catechol 2,3-dioxygenase-like lactoylglutathione lyase family enzyme